MPRFSFSVLVLAGALLGVAADSPQADVGPAARLSPALAEMAMRRPDDVSPGSNPGASSLPTDCPCAGECGMAEQARHRDE